MALHSNALHGGPEEGGKHKLRALRGAAPWRCALQAVAIGCEQHDFGVESGHAEAGGRRCRGREGVRRKTKECRWTWRPSL